MIDFICKIRDNLTLGDYTSLSDFDAGLACDITIATSKVFSVSSLGTYAPLTDDGGGVTASSGGTGTLKHISKYNLSLIINVVGTFGAGDTVTCNGSGNTFTISDAGDQVGCVAAECYNDWPSGLDDGVKFNDDSGDIWITDRTDHYIKIYTPESERHTGIRGSGFHIINSSSTVKALMNRIERIDIDGIDMQSPNRDGIISYYSSKDRVTNVKNTILSNYQGPTAAAVCDGEINNCLIFDGGSAAGGPYVLESNNPIRNCTIYADGWGGYNGNIILRGVECYNVVIYNTIADSWGTFYQCTGDYNACSDDNVPGANSLINISDPFTDRLGADFSIPSGSPLENAGTDLSAFIDAKDILGTDRDATWDIGAFEYFASGGSLLSIKNTLDEINKGAGPITAAQLGGVLVGG